MKKKWAKKWAKSGPKVGQMGQKCYFGPKKWAKNKKWAKSGPKSGPKILRSKHNFELKTGYFGLFLGQM